MLDPTEVTARAPFVHLRNSVEGPVYTGTPNLVFEAVSGHEVRWQVSGAGLVIQNDTFGFQPLFVSWDRDAICVSTSLEVVVRERKLTQLNDRAIAAFLRLGYYLGDDTPFAGVNALPPRSRLVWDEGEVTLSQDTIEIERQSSSVTILAEQFKVRFARAIEANVTTSGRTVVPLSGGRDSRHILAELSEQGAYPDAAVTVRHPGGPVRDEVRQARAVAHCFRVHHEVVPQPKDWIQQERRKNALTHYLADEHTWLLPVADLAANRFDRVYDGLAGDVLAAGLYLTPYLLDAFRKGDLVRVANALLLRESRLGNVLSEEAGVRFGRAIAFERILEEIGRHQTAPNPVSSFFFWNRTRREVSLVPFAILGSASELTVHTPFLAPELASFLLGVPAELYSGVNLHDFTLKSYYPTAAMLPYKKDDQSVWGWIGRNQAARILYRRSWIAPDYMRNGRKLLRSLEEPNLLLARPQSLAKALLRDAVVMGGHDETMSLIVYLNQLESLARRSREP